MARKARTQVVPPKDEGMNIDDEVPPASGPIPVEGQGPTTAQTQAGVFDPSRLIPTRPGTRYAGSQISVTYESYGDLLNAYDELWGTSLGDGLNQLLINSGYVTPGAKVKSTFVRGYKDAIEEAQRRNIPLSELLNRFPISTATDVQPSGAGAGGPFRSETTSITEYDPTNVSDIANAAYRSKLGRNATKEEREILADILNKEQRRNPQVTISEGTRMGKPVTAVDGTLSGTRGTVSTTTTRGGIDTSEIAQQAALEDEDYEETFNKVVAFDLMKRVLDRPV